MTCIKCRRPADFVHPALLCSEHWCRWWGAEDPTGQMYRDAKWSEFVNRLPLWQQPLAEIAYGLMEGVAGVLRWRT